MGFTKLDERITRSSIMAEPSDTFKVWIAMLAECGPDGVADVSALYLARICYLPFETVGEALKKLSGPDPLSRSKKSRGARIKKVEEGYFVVNYHQYRERGYSTSEEAAKKREYRARKSGGEDNVRTKKTMSGHSASASASASSSLRGKESSESKKGEGKSGAPVDPEMEALDKALKEQREEEAREAERKKTRRRANG